MPRFGVVGLVSTLLAQVAWAQPPISPSDDAVIRDAVVDGAVVDDAVVDDAVIVTEDDFLAVLDDHPALAESASALDAARADTIEASLLENPTVGFLREDPSGPDSLTEWTVAWELPRPGRRLMIEAARRRTDAAAATLDGDRTELRSVLRQAYADWALATVRHRLLAAHLDRLGTLETWQTARAERGEASTLDARRVGLEVSTLGALTALAATDAAAAEARARGWNPELPADAEPTMPALPVLPDPVSAPGPSPSERDHPRTAAAQSDLEAARLERRLADRVLRAPELLVGWQRQDFGADTADGPLLGLTWSVPLFQRNQAAKERSTARVAAAHGRLEHTQRQVEADRRAARARYAGLVHTLAGFRTAIADPQGLLPGAETAFRHGESSLTDFLGTLRAVIDAETQALDLHRDALAAHRAWERLAAHSHSVDAPHSQDESDTHSHNGDDEDDHEH